MITVIGGTGTTGKYVVRELQDRGVEFRCIVRDEASGREKLGDGVALVKGDISNSSSIEEGCAGSDTLFLLSPHSPVLGRQQSDAIDAAKRAGVTRIIKLAGMMINPEMLIPSQHVIAEKYLQESGAAWTIIRPCFFMQNLLMTASAVKEQSKMIMPFPSDVPIGMIDVRDSAAVCVKALTEDGHSGKLYELTGAPVTLNDAAAALSTALGSQVHYMQAPLEAAQKMVRDQGAPDWAAEHIGNILKDIEGGMFSRDTGQVQDLLGRPPRIISDFMAENVSIFRD